MTRYLTRHYVCPDREAAFFLAEQDGTPADEVEVAEGVDVVHLQDSWAYWSDGCVTTRIGLRIPKPPRGLPEVVASMVTNAWGSDSGMPEGGWSTLTEIDEILETEDLFAGRPRGHYAAPRLERYRARYKNGSEKDFYVFTAGYFEGYLYELALSLTSPRFAFVEDVYGIRLSDLSG
jgi:hypothetical protein